MSEPSQGPKIDIGEEQARGAQRVGLIWMLVASLVVVVFVMALILAYFAGSLHQANSHGGPGSIPKADAANFHTPG